MERLFASFKDSGTNTGVYDPDDPESYEHYIHALITDSQDYESDTLAGDRDYAQKYFYGFLPSLSGDDNPYSDTTVVQSANATYKEYSGETQDQRQSLAIRFDRRARCCDADAAEFDSAVRRE